MSRILVVDDAAFMRMMLKNILQKNGFEVVGEAENGEVAVAKFQELQPDVVTMDITMPEKDGIEALKEIRSIASDAKVVMVTAMGQEKIVIECLQFGAKSFIVKPFKEDHVVKTITDILGSN